MMICIESGVDLSKTVVSGVYKTDDFIESLIKNGTQVNCFTVESFTQYELLTHLALKYSRRIKLLLRLTSGNQFGLDESGVKEIISSNDPDTAEIIGIQYFRALRKHLSKG